MRYQSLDVLRGLAALWVFSFHFHYSDAFVDAFPAVVRLTMCGPLGVPIFFVLSGYCVTASARKALETSESAGSFLRRRLVRIYPPLWFSIALVLAIPFLLAAGVALKRGAMAMPQHIPGSELSVADWAGIVTLARVFSPNEPDLWQRFAAVNGVYWSLAIEVQFYVVLAAAMFARRWFYAVLAAVTAICLPFTFLSWQFITGFFLPLWIQFVLGVAVFFCLERGFGPQRVFGRVAAAVGGTVVTLIVGAMGAMMLCGGKPSAINAAVLCAVAMWFGSAVDPWVGRLRKSPRAAVRVPLRLLFALGAMSYSLYLTHTALPAIPRTIIRQLTPTESILADAVVFVSTLLLCYPFYRYCEAPFIHRRVTAPATSVSEQSPEPAPAAVG